MYVLIIKSYDDFIKTSEEIKKVPYGDPRYYLWSRKAHKFVRDTYGREEADQFEATLATIATIIGREDSFYLNKRNKKISNAIILVKEFESDLQKSNK